MTVTPDAYVSVDDIKDAVGIEQDDDRRDALLTGHAESASRQIDDFCGRYFGQVGTEALPVARTYDVTGSLLIIDDLVSLTGVEYEAGTAWSDFAGAVVLLPRDAVSGVPASPFTMLRTATGSSLPSVVRVTGVWGWPTTPQPIKDAAALQAVRLFKSKDVALGVVGGGDMLGTMRLAQGLHPDAQTLCAPYQRLSLG